MSFLGYHLYISESDTSVSLALSFWWFKDVEQHKNRKLTDIE